MFLTEGAESGLTQAGELLWRSDPSLVEHVLWVNPEVPAEMAPMLERDRRMYAVAVRKPEQQQVMVLHPWLDEKKLTTYDAFLDEREAYGLSRVMDVWRSSKREPVHFFVVENAAEASTEPGGVWSDFFQRGQLVWVCKRRGRFKVHHPATGEEDLEEVFGVTGKTFWISKWLTQYWLEKLGYYVGVESGGEHDPRLWAALGPNAPRSTLSAIQHLCGIVHHPTFRHIVSQIPECQSHPGQYRLYRRGSEWHLDFRNKQIPLRRKAAWPYIQHLFRNPRQTVTCRALGQLYRLRGDGRERSRANVNTLDETADTLSRAASPPFEPDLTGSGGKQKLPSPQASVRAYAEWEALEKFKDMVDKGGDQDESARGELLAILQEYPRFGPANGEHQEAWRKRLDRLRNRLRKTAMPNNKTPYKPEVDLTDRVNTAIRREVDLLVTEIPYLGQYLRSVLKDGHSDWTYTGTEEWDTSPVAETVTKAQPSSG